jgi:hypothetical protein
MISVLTLLIDVASEAALKTPVVVAFFGDGVLADVPRVSASAGDANRRMVETITERTTLTSASTNDDRDCLIEAWACTDNATIRYFWSRKK